MGSDNAEYINWYEAIRWWDILVLKQSILHNCLKTTLRVCVVFLISHS
jgi:hypothetical protein